MKYATTRNGQSLKADKTDIESVCQQISFINNGDTPVTVTIRGTDLSFELQGKTDQKTDYVVFGTMNPEFFETSVFNITFDALVTTKDLKVMRVYVNKIN